MNSVKIFCAQPAMQRVSKCQTKNGVIQMGSGAPIAIIGPTPRPVLVIPLESASVSVVPASSKIERFELSAYNILALPSGTERFSCAGSSELILVPLHENALDESLKHSDKSKHKVRSQDLTATVRLIRKHLVSNEEPCRQYIESCIEVLVYHINESIICESSRRYSSKLLPQEWRGILRAIDGRLSDSPTVKDLADLLGMSPSQCSRVFKSTVGYPPQEYIRERKVQKARKLLLSTSRSLADIALDAGFCSQAHMTATFSKTLGITPARYRTQQESLSPLMAGGAAFAG